MTRDGKINKEPSLVTYYTLREVNIITQMGGNEFLLIFPDNPLEEASLIKDCLQKNFSQLNEIIKKDS